MRKAVPEVQTADWAIASSRLPSLCSWLPGRRMVNATVSAMLSYVRPASQASPYFPLLHGKGKGNPDRYPEMVNLGREHASTRRTQVSQSLTGPSNAPHRVHQSEHISCWYPQLCSEES